MNIGRVELSNNVFAAPLAGVSDRVYRELALEAGCGLVYTEMISAQSLIYANKKTLSMLDLDDQYPVSIQLFGSRPDVMTEAAGILEQNGAGIIDINMGCPTPKIVKNGEGCALMQKPVLAAEIISKIAERVQIPVTVKIRKGWDEQSANAVEIAQIAEENGAAAIAVHGRTREQFYSGKADWDIIGQVKDAVRIPVIGNGDIFQPEDALRMVNETGCDAVMIGRGTLGNPWLLQRTVKLLTEGIVLPEPSPKEKIEMALRHFLMLRSCKGERRACLEMRKHASWYTKGLTNAAQLRQQINQTDTADELVDLLESFSAIY